MGILDDAIREHLELRRRHGASEEEVERQQEEALGRTTRAQSAQEALDRQRDEASEEHPMSAEEPPADSAELEADAVPFVEPGDNGLQPDDLDPDEVLPEESLESAPPAAAVHDQGPAHTGSSGEETEDWERGEDVPGSDIEDEDVLEETPEFLEETPEQDRLWFEQKPPKDFDFGD